MKRMVKLFSRLNHKFSMSVIVMVGSALAACPAMAESGAGTIVLPTTVDLSPILTYGGVIVASLVGMIVLRKAIKLTNRS